MASDQHNKHNVLISGCFRSGTTLLDKLLNTHEQMLIASQPFPNLYFYAKGKFLEAKGIKYRYPLSHMLRQECDFAEYLNRHHFSSGDIDSIFADLKGYTNGLKTPEILNYRNEINPGTFFELFTQFNSCIGDIFGASGVHYIGSKEAFIEEYIPFFLEHKSKVIIILRDPRSVITSVYFSNKEKFMGDDRPLLFLLRSWRKSVAYALAFEEHPDFHFIKYEDLIENPLKTLNEICKTLGVTPFKQRQIESELTDQYGKTWLSNSSFSESRKINPMNQRRYREHLDTVTLQYIESACFPEMQSLGYAPETIASYEADHLESYREKFNITHPKFINDPDYSFRKKSIQEEQQRINYLTDPSSMPNEQMRQWFIEPTAFAKLSKSASEFCKDR